MKKYFLFVLLIASSVVLYAAGLWLGMTGAGKQKVKELDEKVREKKKKEITNQSPTLSWTGEANYTSDGLHPETGNTSTTFIYRVKYTDADNDAPSSGYPKVHIKKAGAHISGSPFAMSYVSGNYNTGAIYTYQRTLSLGTDYTYYFEAKDSKGVNATGEPTSPKDAPDVFSEWQRQTVDEAGEVGWYTSIALDASGNPYISYSDYTNYDLKYAK